MHPAKDSFTKSDMGVIETQEFQVCPYCNSKNIDEISTARRIESIQSVKINEADEWLKKGYEVKESYASTVTLVKYAQKQTTNPTENPSLPERQAAIEKDSAELRKDLEDFNK
jgi:hypothetical protein